MDEKKIVVDPIVRNAPARQLRVKTGLKGGMKGWGPDPNPAPPI